ncbi:MAG: iron-containing redox enzyme family protein [Nitrosospira sp.]
MPRIAVTHVEYPLLSRPFTNARNIYFSLLNPAPDHLTLARSRIYLSRQLEAAKRVNADIPRDLEALSSWIDANTLHAGNQYAEYLKTRKAGGPRHYFVNKSHALYFLKSVAPTKLVDGAWLYGLLEHWDDGRYSDLIRIYLEELGEGVPDKNHVVIFKQLLASHGCDQWKNLSDAHYVQGAIQLSLAYHADAFLPEAIGFNLGYEQLPLHLLISAYELNELGIDPYYFTLHITVDNAVSGHAKKALHGLFDALPGIANRKAFFQRVINGFNLNSLGASTNSIIDDFDHRQELLAIFATKSIVGAQMHSDYCRVAGKSVNQWLSDLTQIPAFLDSLEQVGWIRRHRNPEESRFWKLLQGEQAQMFGVFNAYERQVVYDWIAGNWVPKKSDQLTLKRRQWQLRAQKKGTDIGQRDDAPRAIFRDHHLRTSDKGERLSDFNMELRLLEEQLAAFESRKAALTFLTTLMSPATHHTAQGLMATRIFTTLLSAP